MHDPFEKNNSHSPSQFLRFHLRSVTKMEPVRDRMIDREQKKIRRPLTLEDGKRMMLKTLGELDPEDEADPKSHPLEDDYKYQKEESKGNENERMSGSPFSEENFTIFCLSLIVYSAEYGEWTYSYWVAGR
uniref:uncharacterized protein LOC122605579 isoform X1 n=1 Tax=Erigeron canadensis TaxID=72917 RepID=UPI001CB91BB8|nr:uncharacterized protein LOC122605579 isoform X1 [Erigeron canadensis]